MRKSFNDYKLYVFDLDGTLYDQPKLRMIMAARLVLYYLCHPFSIREMFILRHFRIVKDSWTKNSQEKDIIAKTASDMKAEEDAVANIVERWIYDSPLDVIKKTRDGKLIALIERLRTEGKKVVILSDYPTEDKLAALDVTVDGQYGPDDPRIDELKPSPGGLLTVIKDMDVPAEDVLMIGDRQEKDGQCAIRAGVDHLILARNVSKRNIDAL